MHIFEACALPHVASYKHNTHEWATYDAQNECVDCPYPEGAYCNDKAKRVNSRAAFGAEQAKKIGTYRPDEPESSQSTAVCCFQSNVSMPDPTCTKKSRSEDVWAAPRHLLC